MRIGAHVSITGGFTNALKGINEKGGNCLQVFASSPRLWSQPTIPDESIEKFQELKQELRIDPIYFHACYLINLANNEVTGERSVSSLIQELKLATSMGVRGSIVHLGSLSNGTYESLISNISKVLEHTPSDTKFIIENAGTRKIGTQIDEISKIIRDVNDERVTVCLDTCHLHAAGYDLSTMKQFETFFSDFDKKIGLERLEVVHVNDSKDPLGSNRDRHENIGEGTIPTAVFELLLTHQITRNTPFILEVPGFDKKGPDKRNMDILKEMIENN